MAEARQQFGATFTPPFECTCSACTFCNGFSCLYSSRLCASCTQVPLDWLC